MTSNESIGIRFWDKAIWALIIPALPILILDDMNTSAFPDMLQSAIRLVTDAWFILGFIFVAYTLVHLIRNKEVDNKMIWCFGFLCIGVCFTPFLYYGVHIKKNLRIIQEYPFFRSTKRDEKEGVIPETKQENANNSNSD